MPGVDFRFVAAVFVAALAAGACAPQPVTRTSAELSYEGLQSVKSRRFAHVEVRPGVDFTRYQAVTAEAPSLEFRTPDRAQQQFPLSDEQKDRFRDALTAALRQEFTGHPTLDFVDHAGPSTLALAVRVIDIVAVVPPNTVGQVGRGSVVLEATGNATFVLEVSDSESGELLARAVETRRVSGAASRRGKEMLTSWDDIDALCARWAEASRTGLETLLQYDGA